MTECRAFVGSIQVATIKPEFDGKPFWSVDVIADGDFDSLRDAKDSVAHALERSR